MASVAVELIPVALVVALSPVSVLPALLLVLYSTRPRSAGLAFLLGWLAGLAALTVLFINIPTVFGDAGHAPPPWQLWVRIAIGIALIVTGGWLWLRRGRSGRSPAWLDAIGGLAPSRTAAMGLGLAVANPKIIVACAAAGFVITRADLSPLARGVSAVYFVALAAAGAALPVIAHALAAKRFDQPLERLRQWIQRNQNAISVVTLEIIGLILAYSGLRAL